MITGKPLITPMYQRFLPVGVQYSRIVPALLNVVKRQGAAIAALEARVSALEGGAA